MPAALQGCNWVEGWAATGINVTCTNHEPATSLKLWHETKKKNANLLLPRPPKSSAATFMVCDEWPMDAAVCAGVPPPWR
jgi:hypothetical protein